MDRKQFHFRYYFNAGLNRETCNVDEEGTDVFRMHEDGNSDYVGSIPWYLPEELTEMDDTELDELFQEYEIKTL